MTFRRNISSARKIQIPSPANRIRAVIYCRKSTDRDDKQQNSLDSQLDACMRTVSEKGLEVVDTILESASAKEEWKRPLFARMLDMCRAGKIDYIVVDEVSRLTRNTMDGARVIGLLEKRQIISILASSRIYTAEQANDHFMLQLDAWIAKLDNELRRRNVKARMITCAEKGRWLGKAPFGYRNTVITVDGVAIRKNISIHLVEAEMIRKIFNLRVYQKATLKDISIACKTQFWNTIKHSFSQQSIKKILNNEIYIGTINYSGKSYKWDHESIVDIDTFYDAQEIGYWRADNKDEKKQKSIESETDPSVQYYLKGFIKDSNGIPLTAQVKKWRYVYYNNQNLRSSCKVNISQKEIFQQAEKFFEEHPFSNHSIAWSIYHLADHLYKDKENDYKNKVKLIEKQIEVLNARKNKLLEWFMDGLFDNETFQKNDKILFSEIKKLEVGLISIPKTEIESIKADCKKKLELKDIWYITLKWKDEKEKANILKNWMLELIIDEKKAINFVTIEGFDSIMSLSDYVFKIEDFNDGNATENWTPAYGMKTRCPNH